MACVGLLMVGASLANPLGSDTVDFAVLTFLRSGAVNSRHIIEVQDEYAARDSARREARDSARREGLRPQWRTADGPTADGPTADGAAADGQRSAAAAALDAESGPVRSGSGTPHQAAACRSPGSTSKLTRPKMFKNSLLDSYDGALGGCAGDLRCKASRPAATRRGPPPAETAQPQKARRPSCSRGGSSGITTASVTLSERSASVGGDHEC